MRFYLAEVVLLSLELACALTNHAFGCWAMNRRPCRWLHAWAYDIVHPLTPQSVASARVEYVDRCGYASNFVSTATSGALIRIPRLDD